MPCWGCQKLTKPERRKGKSLPLSHFCHGENTGAEVLCWRVAWIWVLVGALYLLIGWAWGQTWDWNNQTLGAWSSVDVGVDICERCLRTKKLHLEILGPMRYYCADRRVKPLVLWDADFDIAPPSRKKAARSSLSSCCWGESEGASGATLGQLA